jgi:hypothetical protein
MKISRLARPFTCLTLNEPTVAGCIKTIEKYERIVDSFEVHLPLLDLSGPRDVFRSTSRPCIATNPKVILSASARGVIRPEVEERRTKELELAVRQGASAVELELDSFDHAHGPNPSSGRSGSRRRLVGLSTSPKAGRMQSAFAGRIRSMGGEVVMSYHTGGVLRARDAKTVALEAKRRGGDFVKIVTKTPRRQDLYKMLECAFLLDRESPVPFTLMNVGPLSGADRLASVLAGSSWVYCSPNGDDGGAGRPTVDEAVSFIESLGLRSL